MLTVSTDASVSPPNMAGDVNSTPESLMRLFQPRSACMGQTERLWCLDSSPLESGVCCPIWTDAHLLHTDTGRQESGDQRCASLKAWSGGEDAGQRRCSQQGNQRKPCQHFGNSLQHLEEATSKALLRCQCGIRVLATPEDNHSATGQADMHIVVQSDSTTCSPPLEAAAIPVLLRTLRGP